MSATIPEGKFVEVGDDPFRIGGQRFFVATLGEGIGNIDSKLNG